MSNEEVTDRYDDRRIREKTLAYRERLQAEGIEEPSPDFAATATRWKAQRAGSEETLPLRTYRFILIVQPEDGRFRASAPALDGCEAQGATPEEARERLLKALYARLMEMLAAGETPPCDEGAEIVDVVIPVSPQG